MSLTKLFPARESLAAGDRKTANLFLKCATRDGVVYPVVIKETAARLTIVSYEK
jgi:hypothetical protein